VNKTFPKKKIVDTLDASILFFDEEFLINILKTQKHFFFLI